MADDLRLKIMIGRRRLVIAVALGIFLACGPAVVPTTVDAPRLSAVSSAPVTTLIATPPTTALSPAEWPLWQRFDPVTLLPHPETSPIELGYAVVAGPDELVATIYLQDVLPDNTITTALRVVDGSTGEDVVPLVRLEHLVMPIYPFGGSDRPPIQFDPRGSSVYWVHPVNARQGTGGWNLFRYPLAPDRQPEVVHQFADEFEPWDFRVTEDGVAIFGTQGLEPLLIFVNESGKVVAETFLEGLTAVTDGNANGSGFAIPALVWELEDSRLYVAGAAEDRLWVLDLESASLISQAGFDAGFSLSTAMAQWFLPTAQAKGSHGVSRNAVLSADNRHLFLSGARTKLDENGYEHLTGLGLVVLDTTSFEVIGGLDLPVSDVSLTPDGQLLFLTGVTDRNTVDPRNIQASGLYVIDTATMSVHAHLRPEALATVNGFAPEEDQAIVSWWDVIADTNSLTSLRLPSLEVLAERPATGPINVDAGLVLVHMPLLEE